MNTSAKLFAAAAFTFATLGANAMNIAVVIVKAEPITVVAKRVQIVKAEPISVVAKAAASLQIAKASSKAKNV